MAWIKAIAMLRNDYAYVTPLRPFDIMNIVTNDSPL